MVKPTVDALTATVPQLGQTPAEFDLNTNEFLPQLVPLQTQINAVVDWVDETSTTIETDLELTTAAKDAAIAASNAEPWVSGASYNAFDVVISLLDFQGYRAKTTHSGLSTDPSLDVVNWTRNFAGFVLPGEYQEFLSSGTWTKPAGVTFVYVEAIGAGAGARIGGSFDTIYGGGGGAFNQKLLLASDLGTTETVTVGAGGISDASAPTNGGDTTFGTHVTAPGGGDGSGLSNAVSGDGNFDQSSSPRALGGYSCGAGGYGAVDGGSCIKGGGGGGGGGGSPAKSGGTSVDGGNGGDGVSDNTGGDANGAQPGGGAGSHSSGPASTGGDGRLRIWAW